MVPCAIPICVFCLCYQGSTAISLCVFFVVVALYKYIHGYDCRSKLQLSFVYIIKLFPRIRWPLSCAVCVSFCSFSLFQKCLTLRTLYDPQITFTLPASMQRPFHDRIALLSISFASNCLIRLDYGCTQFQFASKTVPPITSFFLPHLSRK